jgi:GxxExxY protein
LVELESVEMMLPIHKAQLLSYLPLNGKEVGLLINFKVEHLRNGIKRVVNSRPKFAVASASSVL